MSLRPTNTVLVVGRLETARFSLREHLGPEYVLREIPTGREALLLAIRDEVDCVVIGDLPDLDTEALLSASRARGLGVVVLTEDPEPQRIIDLLRAGATDCRSTVDLDAAALRSSIARAIDYTVHSRDVSLHHRLWQRMPLGVIVLDVASEPVGLSLAYQNPVAQAAREHARDPSELVVGVDGPTLRGVCARVVTTGEPERLEGIDVSEGRHGPVFDMHVSRLDARSVLVLLEDVTELLLARRQLEAASRMEAVGRLAGGVAHDFNNMLTVITGHAGFIREVSQPGDAYWDDAAAILDAASRSAELTRQLLAFSRRQIRAPRVLELNATVESLQPLLRRIIGEHIVLETRLDPRAGSILADPAQVEQVLMNLAVNARDAMPRGGSLLVETSMRRVTEAFRPGSFVVERGEWVELRVIDQGGGMSAETMARMFEPFFTTKSKDEGTGLGLATVYGIVTQSGGGVAIRSAPGEGCCVEVALPITDEHLPAPVDLVERGAEPRSSGDTILLVEDE
ncbi:MAG: hypothetical protein KC619_33350, partial [Myxococcales bacterium]|nr:hypothetical protein [Myxococcales bacterium]